MIDSINSLIKKEIIDQYTAIGTDKFYQSLLTYGYNKIDSIRFGQYDGVSPELEIMGGYEKFLEIYREDNDEKFLEIAILMRKAAHKIYRILLLNKLTSKNNKFLNRVP